MKMHILFLLLSLVFDYAFAGELKSIALRNGKQKQLFSADQEVYFSERAQALDKKNFMEKLKRVKVSHEKSGETLNPAAQFCELYLGKSSIWKDSKGNEYDVCKIGDHAYVTSWSAYRKWRSYKK